MSQEDEEDAFYDVPATFSSQIGIDRGSVKSSEYGLLRDVLSSTEDFVKDLENYNHQFKPVTGVIKENVRKAKNLSLTLEELLQNALLLVSQSSKFPGEVIEPEEIEEFAEEQSATLSAKRRGLVNTEHHEAILFYRSILLAALIINISVDFMLFLVSNYAVIKFESARDLEGRVREALSTYVPNCTTLPEIENGEKMCFLITETVLFSQFVRKTNVCNYTCDYGYAMSSSENLTCSTTRKWMGLIPNCTLIPCSNVTKRDCAGLAFAGEGRGNGVYEVNSCRSPGATINVYCNFAIDGGGWTAIQRRLSGNVSFLRNFRDFEFYFGDPATSYWIGLKTINRLSTVEPQSLLVVLTDWEYPSYHRKQANALYREFSIGDESSSYRLNVNNFTFIEEPRWECAGDSLEYSDGMQFTSIDIDQDQNLLGNCADKMASAWWHKNCTYANLNGEFFDYPVFGDKTIHWRTWRVLASMKRVEMFIRPQDWKERITNRRQGN